MIDETKGYMVNGVLVTPYKQWAVNLMKREAGGENIGLISQESWREVLKYPKDASAKRAHDAVVAGQVRAA